MTAREQYFNLINLKSINDTLSQIEYLSYSMKINYITELLNLFDPVVINMALNDFNKYYILIHRIPKEYLLSTLKKLCKINKEKHFKGD
jgi:hypothetical protein